MNTCMFGKLEFHNLNYIQRVSEISALILTGNSGIMTPLLNLIKTLITMVTNSSLSDRL
jgi:hypothetical protein